MKLWMEKTKLPESVRKCTPFLIGRRGDSVIMLFAADVDDSQPISREEAETIVQDFAGCDIDTFIKITQDLNAFIEY